MAIKNLTQLKETASRILVLVQKKRSLVFILLLALVFLLAGLIFYQYGYRASSTKVESQVQMTKINEQLYQKVIKQIQEKEQRLKEAEKKTYPDPFR